MPHAVTPLLELEVAAVLLQLIINGFRSVGSAALTTAWAKRRSSGGAKMTAWSVSSCSA
jgi:hypothetical protein